MSEEPLKDEAMLDPEEAEEIQEKGASEPEVEITPPPLPEEATSPPPVPESGVVTPPPLPEAVEPEPETVVVTPSTPVDVVEPEIPSPFDEEAEAAAQEEVTASTEPEVITPEVVTSEVVAPATPTAASEATSRVDKPKEKNNTTLIIIVVAAVLLLVCCCCIIGSMFLSVPIDGIMREMGLSLGRAVFSLSF